MSVERPALPEVEDDFYEEPPCGVRIVRTVIERAAAATEPDPPIKTELNRWQELGKAGIYTADL